jgi:hypothetical protein
MVAAQSAADKEVVQLNHRLRHADGSLRCSPSATPHCTATSRAG